MEKFRKIQKRENFSEIFSKFIEILLNFEENNLVKFEKILVNYKKIKIFIKNLRNPEKNWKMLRNLGDLRQYSERFSNGGKVCEIFS